MDAAVAKLRARGASDASIRAFERRRALLAGGDQGLLPSAALEPVRDLPALDGIGAGDAPLDELIVIKVNGGLGTSMGVNGPKSLTEVRPGMTLLDAIVAQILSLRRRHSSRLPLVLMSSPDTFGPTEAALAAHPAIRSDVPLQFVQEVQPRLDAETLDPVSWPDAPALEWCPPGHGEVYGALRSSGMLQTLLDAGYRYAFLSNADNLAAVVDPRILAWMAEAGAPFVMEVVEGTPSDRKGGHIAWLNGRLVLRETAQTPPEDAASFRDFRRWRFYNTNNLWVDLRALAHALEAHGGSLPLPLIVNEKPVDAHDPSSPRVVQLETAMGAALGVLDGARALQVPRRRFAPVKTTDDLLVLLSDVYRFEDGFPQPVAEPPFVALDPAFFKTLDAFRERFPGGPPSLRECTALHVRGDVTFGAGVRVIGDVRIDAAEPTRIADGEVLRG